MRTFLTYLLAALLLLPSQLVRADVVEPEYPEPVPAPKKKALNVAVCVKIMGLKGADAPKVKGIIGRNNKETASTNAELDNKLFCGSSNAERLYAIRMEGTDDLVYLPYPAAVQTFYYSVDQGIPVAQSADPNYPIIYYQLEYDPGHGGRYLAKVVKIEYYGKVYEGDDIPSLNEIIQQNNGGVPFSLTPGSDDTPNPGAHQPLSPNVMLLVASAAAGLALVAFVLRLRARRRMLAA